MRLLRCILFSFFLLPGTMTNAQGKFELEGHVKGYEGKTKLILNFIRPDHEADMESETELYMTDGRFRIEGQLPEPALLSIRIRPEMTGEIDVRAFESTFIWVDNKKMILKGEKGNFEYCTVTGYSRQEENEKSKLYVRDQLSRYAGIIDSLSGMQSGEATRLLNHMKSFSQVYLKNKYLLDYSYDNPNSFVAVYNYSWFVKWLPEMAPKSHAIDFYNSLDDDLKNNAHGKQIKYYIDSISVNRKLKAGDRYYDFSLNDSTGKAITLSAFKGKVVLLDFWASNCGPCRKEHQNYARLYHQFRQQGFEILSVSQDRSKKSWEKAMIKDNITWPSAWDETMTVSKYIYLVSGIPQNYLVDSNGIILAENIKGAELENMLKKRFNQ